MKRITTLAAAAALVATPTLGAWAASASTDDTPAAHLGVADRHGEPEPGDDHGRHHHRHHLGPGADDPAGHARHGADDPAGHARHSGEPEPGDDNGGGTSRDDSGSRDSGHHGEDGGGHHGDDD